MPAFAVTQLFPFPRPAVFAFFRRPANVVAVAPPGLRLSLVAGPELLEAGSRLTVRSRRWGIAADVVTEVVELVEPERIVEEQVRGPFRRWRHERHFLAAGEALTELSERIDYEPPGGLLGLTLTPSVIEAELAEAFAWRQARVRSCWAGRPEQTTSRWAPHRPGLVPAPVSASSAGAIRRRRPARALHPRLSQR